MLPGDTRQKAVMLATTQQPGDDVACANIARRNALDVLAYMCVPPQPTNQFCNPPVANRQARFR